MYAVKFFATQQDFKNEARLYSRSSEVVECMPDVIEKVDNQDGCAKDRFGNKMPPFIVMEKGLGLTTMVPSSRGVDCTTIARARFLYTIIASTQRS